MDEELRTFFEHVAERLSTHMDASFDRLAGHIQSMHVSLVSEARELRQSMERVVAQMDEILASADYEALEKRFGPPAREQ
jgi:hypothetical protein